MIRKIAAVAAAIAATACASTVSNTVEGGPAAQGFIRVRSDFNAYSLVLQLYDAESGQITPGAGIVKLAHPPSFWTDADPNVHHDFAFKALPGRYVIRSFEFSYANRNGRTCFTDTFVFELVEGRNTYAGSYAAIGPGERSTYAVLSRDPDETDKAGAAFAAAAKTDAPLAMSDIRPVSFAKDACVSGMTETTVFSVQ